MKYLTADFRIDSQADLLQTARDLLADAAGEAGFESFEDTPQGLKGYVQEDLFDAEKLDSALTDFPLPGVTVSYTIEKVADKDWNETWENNGFEPIAIGGRILVYDARQQAPAVPQGMTAIGIRAIQAFGTGTHQTTRMVIAAMMETGVQGQRVLDCGCGTGILGLAASKLGAENVVGYDIDEWSVENARQNAELNHVDNMEVLHGNSSVLSHVSGLFQVVVANINRNILLGDMGRLREMMLGEGTMILSGFYEDDTEAVCLEARRLGFVLTGKKTQDRWCCLVFTLA